jgi:hypothetical protein
MSLSIKSYIDGTLATTEQGASFPAEHGEIEIPIEDIQYHNAETGISWSGDLTLTLKRFEEQIDDRSDGDYTDVIKGSFVKINSMSFSDTRLWVLEIVGITPWKQEHRDTDGNIEKSQSVDYDDPSQSRRPYVPPYNYRRHICNPSSIDYSFNCSFGVNAQNKGHLEYKRDGGELVCEGEGRLRRDSPATSTRPHQWWEYVRTWELNEIRIYFYLPKARVNVVSYLDSTGSYYYAMPLGNVKMPSVAGLMPPANCVFAGWDTKLTALSGDPDATNPWPFNAGDDITMEDFFSGDQISDYTEFRLQPDKTDTVIGGGKYRYPLYLSGTGNMPLNRAVSNLPTKAAFVIYPRWHSCTYKLIRDRAGNLIRTADGKLVIDA